MIDLIDRNTEFTKQAVQVVVAVVVDRDVPLLFPVVKGDAGVEALAELVLEMLDVGRRFLGGLAPATALASLAAACQMGGNELLGIAYGSRCADQFLRDQDLLVVSFEGQENLGVTGAEATLGQVVLHRGGEFKQTHGVGHGGAAFTHALADFFLGESKFLGKAGVGGGLFDRIEPLALEILDEGQFQHLLVARLADDNRGLGQADLERGAETAFARDQLVLSGNQSDDQRLDDAALTDRVNEFAELLLPELGAGLKRAGDDPVEGDLLDALPFLNDGCRRGDSGIDKRTEPLAKPFTEPTAQSFGGRWASVFSVFWFRHHVEVTPNFEVGNRDL